MRTSIVVLIAVVGLALAPAALGAQTPEGPLVVVAGQGVVTVVPDTAWLTIGAEHRARRQPAAGHGTSVFGLPQRP